jgi:hypothetical protein
MKPLFDEPLVMLRVLATTSLSVTALRLTALGALVQPGNGRNHQSGEVEAAQEAWCDALAAISRTHAKGGLKPVQASCWSGD